MTAVAGFGRSTEERAPALVGRGEVLRRFLGGGCVGAQLWTTVDASRNYGRPLAVPQRLGQT
ncbi:hypothetical protein RCH21_003119 [Arthrobacter sp. PL16]|nr:hypothetical protein [Arthrobacter sp. PL16]